MIDKGETVRAVQAAMERVISENRLSARFVIVGDMQRAVLDALKQVPEVESEWETKPIVRTDGTIGSYVHKCKRCGMYSTRYWPCGSAYCEACGARMRNGES